LLLLSASALLTGDVPHAKNIWVPILAGAFAEDAGPGCGSRFRKEVIFLRSKPRKIRKPQLRKPAGDKSVSEIVRELKEGTSSGYREQSLRIHGLICAKCGREFEFKDRNFLTVHHKDGNCMNNPPDGSNWENLCVYCHDDEHSRGLLGDYLR
jgi:5-methylcytosine-specific restriction endonuclease McrA